MISFLTKIKKNFKILAIQSIELVLVVVCLILSFWIAGFLIYGSYLPFGVYQGIFFYCLATSVAIMILASNKYFNFLDISFLGIMGKATWIILSIHFIFVMLLYFFTAERLSIYYFTIAATLQIGSLLLIKIFSGLLKRNLIRSKTTLIIGKSSEKDLLLKTLRKQCDNKLYFIDENEKNLLEYIDKSDYIYVIMSTLSEFKQQVISYCELRNKRLFVIPEVHEIALKNSELTKLGDIPLFTVESFRLTEAQAIIKRLMDIFLSLVGILLSSPILLISAICIKIEDNGPVFYRQIRTGINGKEFNIWKLRSMVIDAEKEKEAIFSTDCDPRVTKVGRFIRCSRIDEIPQFFNTLMGDMSVVGPRPERPVFVEKFSAEKPEYIQRLYVKPGITGLAQVMANYTTTPENKLKFDLFYIKSYSPLFDINILIKTVRVVFQRNSAKGFSSEQPSEENKLFSHLEGEYSRPYCGAMKGNHYYSWLRASLIFASCLILVGASIFMRYSPLIISLSQAINNEEKSAIYIQEQEIPLADQPYSEEIEKANFIPTDYSLAWKDSLYVLYELVIKIDPSDLADLEKMSLDGFTKDELPKVKKIITRNFQEDEKSRLKIIIADL